MRGWVIGIVVAVLVVTRTEARADVESLNLFAGPVLGLRLGDPPGGRLIVGFEGGPGASIVRLNLGVTRRLGHQLYYAELDPWFFVGGSLGVGVDSRGTAHPVLGLWEGVPLTLDAFHRCDTTGDLRRAATLAVGYRWTGVHELYVTVKAGVTQGFGCLD